MVVRLEVLVLCYFGKEKLGGKKNTELRFRNERLKTINY